MKGKDKEPTQILPWLYLGNKYHAIRNDPAKIPCILNVVGGRFPANWSPETFCMVPISDFGRDDLSAKLKHCFAFLQKVHENQQSVLVHCAMGVNRSASVVIAYLVRFENMSLREATKHCLDRRAIRPHDSYLEQLCELEKEWTGKKKSTLSQRDIKKLFPPLF